MYLLACVVVFSSAVFVCLAIHWLKRVESGPWGSFSTTVPSLKPESRLLPEIIDDGDEERGFFCLLLLVGPFSTRDDDRTR